MMMIMIMAMITMATMIMPNHNGTSDAAIEQRPMNLTSLIYCKELCYLSRARAATNGPDESLRSGKSRRCPAKGWPPAQLVASGFGRVARRCPARGWVLAEQACIARGSSVRDGDGDGDGDGDCQGDGDGDEAE